ncbi:MAG: hypothetical protein Q8M16_04105 [Pirellulaceae bacterium]|nr:hypothetical protein [Pirellulaceae bacterium]
MRTNWLFLPLAVFLPFVCLMVIGLSAPQRGQQLDPTGKWYFHFVLQTWAMTWSILLIVTLLAAISPSIRHQFDMLIAGPKSIKQSVSRLVD